MAPLSAYGTTPAESVKAMKMKLQELLAIITVDRFSKLVGHEEYETEIT
jgi:hypothetical protein